MGEGGVQEMDSWGKGEECGRRWVYSFPGAAEMKYHKLGGLIQ